MAGSGKSGSGKAGHRAFAVIAAILAAVLIGRGLVILAGGSYTAAPRYLPAADVTGLAAILYGLSSVAAGAGFAGSLLYLLWDRAQAALLIGGGLGVLSMVLLFASLFAG